MRKTKRKLSSAEEKRKERFEKTCEEMKKAGYEKHDLTVSILQANIIAFIIMLPFVMFFGYLYFRVNSTVDFVNTRYFSIMFFLILIILVVFHEVIHGVTWGSFVKEHFHSISFGVIWKSLTPYCTCDEPLKKWEYIIGVAMPTLILGFGIATSSIFLNSPQLFLLSIIMLFGGGGDFLIIMKIILHKELGSDTIYYDHPYECGVVIFERTL
ncbi:DUF3267 domain-containing protein [Clostridium sp.]|uniref:DUF3267 domain-containing protein n=1 Tax=Clostridium sp. TaxID=1506 RepID=UPI0028FE715C|nr:DUF3267 domain-containing protein [Clostridium sp.]MDU1311507.1 DUF3267 domain-containing protein [Clostridium sp.]MDU1408974.1 DUF3267 domain-containing protein [Clostridium sp.]MDU2283733.1 DUF3267 domain-containing protein [Clostridium sp.]MDU2995382.1 DUF3267 domain-containing protein [Clostridium sp.]